MQNRISDWERVLGQQLAYIVESDINLGRCSGSKGNIGEQNVLRRDVIVIQNVVGCRICKERVLCPFFVR